MAQKNFFAIVTLIACLLALVWADWTLLDILSGKGSSAPILAAANAFGVIGAGFLLTAIFMKKKSRVLVWSAAGFCVLCCVIASLNGWAAAASIIGAGILTVLVFALFVLAIIRYEDMGQPRR